ncbi:unnamed protein product [Effrenium voratum]|uniref:Uncharacterized protein n=1 Tax=Effrenium voratum TaxID=2562239 RepID=A0AA36MH04_9DINO|nr:unnamed protein product [Effrenium voratum]
MAPGGGARTVPKQKIENRHCNEKNEKKPKKEKKKETAKANDIWGAQELDERQKHDIGLLSKQGGGLRKEVPRKKRDSTVDPINPIDTIDPVVQQILERYGSPQMATQSVQSVQTQMMQMMHALKSMAQDLSASEQRALAAEESLASTESELARAQPVEAAEAVEELELETPKRTDQDRERKLLKEAILRGAKLSRAKAEVEKQKAEAELEQRVVELQRRASLDRSRRRREADAADAAEQRAERAEERLADYLRASTSGADAVVKSHMQHLATASQGLAQKVSEQAEIIEVLRGLLQDHKAFIRKELGSELSMPKQDSDSGSASSDSS